MDYARAMGRLLRQLEIDQWTETEKLRYALLEELEQLNAGEEKQEQEQQAKDRRAKGQQAENRQAKDRQAENKSPTNGPAEGSTSPDDTFMRTVGVVWGEIVASVGPSDPQCDPTSRHAGAGKGGNKTGNGSS